MPRFQKIVNKSLVRLLLAHVIACYVWVGVVAVVGSETQSVPESPHAAADHSHDDDDDDAWFLWPWVMAAAAPIAVPCLFVVAAKMTFASPVESFPMSLFLMMIGLYAAAACLAYVGLTWLSWRRRGTQPHE